MSFRIFFKKGYLNSWLINDVDKQLQIMTYFTKNGGFPGDVDSNSFHIWSFTKATDWPSTF